MSDFKAKMHQIQFRLGLPLAVFKGLTSKGSGGKERVDGAERSLYFFLRIYAHKCTTTGYYYWVPDSTVSKFATVN